MSRGVLRRVWILFALLLCMPSLGPAQQLPPVQPPLPMPSPAGDSSAPTLRVTTTEVLVPTLVEKHDGTILYGLKAGDFELEDNGVPQKIHVQAEMDTAPVALVIAVEEGGASVLEFGKLAQMGPLLDLFLADPRSRAALVGFDSEPHLIHDYTRSSNALNRDLRRLEPGDGGAAILDTISYAVDLLQTQPKGYRRVLLLIGEKRDHGSRYTKIEQLVRKIGRSDVLVLSVSFSPARGEFMHDVQDSGDNRTMNMVSALVMLIKAFKKNVAKEVALMSGGEYTTFAGDRRFEQRIVDAAKQDYGARIVARANYWMQAGP